MKSLILTYIGFVIQILYIVLAAVMLLPQSVFAECKEFKIVEYEDRVEAVCVGEPLTEAQKKTNQEEEKRQEAAAQRQRNEEQQRQRATEATNKSKAETKAAEERKKFSIPPVAPQKPGNKNMINPNEF